MKVRTVESILEEAVKDGMITCPKCENKIEPDGPECGICGWENPIVILGLI